MAQYAKYAVQVCGDEGPLQWLITTATGLSLSEQADTAQFALFATEAQAHTAARGSIDKTQRYNVVAVAEHVDEGKRSGVFLADDWRAETVDGRQWCEHDEVLQGKEHAPWRELEAICQREGIGIAWAQINLGRESMRFNSDGCPLLCGQKFDTSIQITPGRNQWQFETPVDCAECPAPPPIPRPSGRYRWICRDEITRKVWGVIGEGGTVTF